MRNENIENQMTRNNLIVDMVIGNLTNFTEEQLIKISDMTAFELQDRETRSKNGN